MSEPLCVIVGRIEKIERVEGWNTSAWELTVNVPGQAALSWRTPISTTPPAAGTRVTVTITESES